MMLDRNVLYITDDGHKNLKIFLNNTELKNIVDYTLHRSPGEFIELSVKLLVTEVNSPNNQLSLKMQ